MGSDAAKVMTGVHSTADHLEDATITVDGLISNVRLCMRLCENDGSPGIWEARQAESCAHP
jgi:hypothetical protein